MHSLRGGNQRWCKPCSPPDPQKHEDHQRSYPYTACRAGKRQCPHLSTGLCHHYAKWQILHSCQSRIQRAGSRYDPRSVFYRLYTFYRTNVRSQVKQWHARTGTSGAERNRSDSGWSQPTDCYWTGSNFTQSWTDGSVGLYFCKSNACDGNECKRTCL